MDINGVYIPVEVLSKILGYLPLDDRRNARLVCQEWNKTCNQEQFLKKEIFDFYTLKDKHKLLSLFEHSKRPFLDLRLYNTKFTTDDMPFWETVGSKIRTLHFHHCTWKENLLTDIIIECQFLTHLTLIIDVDPHSLTLLLQTLWERNIKKSELISLEINVFEVGEDSNDVVQQIFSIFPKIQCLRFSLPGYTSEELVETTSIFSNICIAALHLKDQIDELHLLNSQDTREMPFADIISFKKLKKLTIEQDSLILTDHFLTGLSQLENLKFLDVKLNDIKPSAADFLVYMVQYLPNLQHLRFFCRSTLSVDEQVFTALSYSSFVVLDLETFYLRYEEFEVEEDLPKNFILQSLRISTVYGSIPRNLVLLFMKHFANIEDLQVITLGGPRDLIYEFCKFQNKLRTLRKISIDLDDTTWNEPSSSPLVLETLEHLEVDIIHTDCVLNTTLDRFLFPNLNYLNIKLVYINPLIDSPSDEITEYVFRMIGKFSSLRVLIFSNRVPYRFLLRMCGQLKQLRHLRTQVKKCSKKACRKLFQACPSLEVFQNTTNRDIFFTKDTITNEIVCRTTINSGPYFFAKFGYQIYHNLIKVFSDDPFDLENSE